MKQFRTLLIVAVIALGFNAVQAQSKIGHIDTNLLISLMPEAKALSADLEKLQKTYESELKAEGDKLEAKLKRYEAEAQSQTEAENQRRAGEVQQERQRLIQSSQIAQEDIRKKEMDGMQPILEKAKTAIEEVAKSEGYNYILEKSTLIYAEGTDILPLVKAKLGIQ